MVEVFIHVPEQHAGNPITLPEVVDHFVLLGEAPFMDLILNVAGVMSPEEGAWFYMKAALKAGVPAFVHLPSVGRWVRIPPNYWRDQNSPLAPVLFEGMPEAVGHDPEMIGQPTVVWEGAFDSLATMLLRAADQIRERAEHGDFDAWDLCRNTLPSMIQMATVTPVADAVPNVAARKAEEQRLADHFDRIGLGKRDLRQPHVAAEWNTSVGIASTATTIASLMKGKKAGKPRSG